MISAAQNLSSSVANLNRALGGGVRATAQLAGGNSSIRTVDEVDNTESRGVELPQREDARQAIKFNKMNERDLVQDAANILATKTAVRANVAVVKSADRTLGSLLDVMG